LHELGHAVMHAAMRAAGAGGPHKIDDCYGPALAWSEGWATFFAAAVHLEPSDPDARFEFLVPRRAPIRLENVPEDVCRGQANEWRVAAALWDLYDSHPDGADASSLPLGRLWTAWEGQRMGSLADYLKRLAPKLSPSERAAADASLRQNTMDEAVPPGGNLASRLPLSAPRFDPR
ncbi:MAG: hypothetical protein HY554_04135, partial [Elusimicrobia bacterium]|nr:hypothetical protein [Elusimicrobiota bacterium]